MNQNPALWAILFVLGGTAAFILLIITAFITQGFVSGVFSTLAVIWFVAFWKMLSH